MRSTPNRQQNKSHRTRLRSQVKRLRQAIESGKADEATALLNPTIALLDHSRSVGVMARNTAARTKSRLTRHVARLNAGS